MTFKIINPNYSREVLEEAAAAVIKRHDSTEWNYKQPIDNFEKNANLGNEKNPANRAGN